MKKCIFIGQAMPRVKKNPHDWPSLNLWLSSIEISKAQIQKYFVYSALIDYFPGSVNGHHRVPTKAEIEKERNRLSNTFNNFSPEVVVPIGKLSITYCMNNKVEKLSDWIGKVFRTNPYGFSGEAKTVIPFPHPSKASTWHYSAENKLLLERALNLLKISLL